MKMTKHLMHELLYASTIIIFFVTGVCLAFTEQPMYAMSSILTLIIMSNNYATDKLVIAYDDQVRIQDKLIHQQQEQIDEFRRQSTS